MEYDLMDLVDVALEFDDVEVLEHLHIGSMFVADILTSEEILETDIVF